jgi:hypothetical protein
MENSIQTTTKKHEKIDRFITSCTVYNMIKQQVVPLLSIIISFKYLFYNLVITRN